MAEFLVYWAFGKYRESEKDRPWLEFVITPDGRHCYPITHIKPDKKHAWKCFALAIDDPDFPSCLGLAALSLCQAP